MEKRVLSFGTHPDDIEIGCGGTEALLARKGYEITHVILTSGEAGSDKTPPWELGPIREKEAIEAAKVIGAGNVEFLRYPDGLTGFTREMKIDIIRIVRRLRPHILFIHERNESSLGHRVASELVLEAVQAGSGPWFQEAGGGPWSPRSSWAMRSGTPWGAASLPSTSLRPWRQRSRPWPATARRRRPSATTRPSGGLPAGAVS